jgi:two-component system NtrC family sensor kinase
MEKLRATFAVSFRAKVLVPVIAVMVLLMAMTMFVVNYHITQQVETDARETLATAERNFRNSQSIRTRNLVLRFRSIRDEPKYKATFQLRHSETIGDNLAKILTAQEVDFVMFTPNGEPTTDSDGAVLKKLDQLVPDGNFYSATAKVVARALDGEEKADTVRVGAKLFDVVSVPVSVDNTVIGALTFGNESWKAAQELRAATRDGIVLVAGDHVVGSTFRDNSFDAQLARTFREIAATTRGNEDFGVRQVTLGAERFYFTGGRFETLSQDSPSGFLLLHSCEPPLRALHEMQQAIFGISALAILVSTIVVGFLVSRVTAPLRELRDSAEAVGKGDFSRRVEIRSPDECGELAVVFNQMTENLKKSREQLEMTVDSLKATQAQLIQSEKLSGIGEFVAGVAHELNNPLASVMGFSELLSIAPDVDPKHKRHLEMINKCAVRCQKIVQALLSFARRRAPERKVVCVNKLIEAAAEILTYQLRTSNIEIKMQLDPNLPQAMVDPHLIQQVFVNIINNARQAIEAHSPKGWIKVSSETRRRFVRIAVQDSGPGIAQENLSKIFDPFFTTKEVGKGTGLGLSMCYGIIKDHGGTITPLSASGEGATFVIELPITREVAESVEEPDSSSSTEFVNMREGIGKRVLVIDDEESILQMVHEALVPRGYEVDVAPDGETALQHLKRKRYDVTLCDWKMPGLNGREVYERIRAQSPAQAERFIFITGDVVNDRTQKFFEERNRPCLPKPFSLRDFRGAIRKVTETKTSL